MWLSRWRYGEALRRDFLYTTKLESKFILDPTGIPSPEGKGLTFKSGLYVFLACSIGYLM